jgi:putative peptidoglycan lipid II flippase
MNKLIGHRFRFLPRIGGQRTFLIGAAGVIALSILTSVVSFGVQVIIAARFGAAAAVDAYLFAMSVPAAVAGLSAAAMSYAIVPALVLRDSDATARDRLVGSLERACGWGALGMVLFGTAAQWLQPKMLPVASAVLLEPGLPALILLAWLLGGLQIILGLKVVQLNAGRRPLLAALLGLFPPLAALLTILVFRDLSIIAAPVGLAIGTACMIGLGSYWSGGFRFRRSPRAAIHELRDLLPTLVSAAFAVSCFTCYAVVDAFWAPRTGTGGLAALGFAQRLLIGIGGLVVAGPSAVLTPRFAERLRHRDYAGFRHITISTIGAVGLSGVLLSIALAIGARPIISLIFGRGAFNLQDVERVTSTFQAMLPGFCFLLMTVVTMRALYCLPRTIWSAALIGVSWIALYFIMSGFLHGLGPVGLSLAFSTAWLFSAIASLTVLIRHSRLEEEAWQRSTICP